MKKILATFLTMALVFGLSSNVLAADKTDPYKAILDSVNEEYNLEIGYVPVDESSVSVEEYENTLLKLAVQQRELLDYIAAKSSSSNSLSNDNLSASLAATGVVKTRTKASWDLGDWWKIKATYTDYGSTLSSCRSASTVSTSGAVAAGFYLSNISSPSYSVIDSGRTSTVSFDVTVHMDSASYSNILLYTEFYYSE